MNNVLYIWESYIMKHSLKVENIGGRDKWQTIVFGFINFVIQEIGMAFLA